MNRNLQDPPSLLEEVHRQYEAITHALLAANWTITTMESCTAGLIASLLTDTEGSSAALKGAFITYSNQAKIRNGVPAETIDRYGVYSPETAREMARACRRFYQADIGIGITGTMGNVDPANTDSTPGDIYFALDMPGGSYARHAQIPPQASRFVYKLQAACLVAGLFRERFPRPLDLSPFKVYTSKENQGTIR